VVFYNTEYLYFFLLASNSKKDGSSVFKVQGSGIMRRVLVLLATVLGVMCGDPPSVALAVRAATLQLKERIQERKAVVCRMQHLLYVGQPKYRGVCVVHTQFPYLRVGFEGAA